MSRLFTQQADAIFLDRTGDYLTIAASASINNLNKFTYAAWVYATGTPPVNFAPIAVKDPFAGYKNPLLLDNGFTPTVVMAFAAYITTTTPAAFETIAVNNTIVLNTWQRLLTTYDDTTDRTPHLYINGVEVTYQQTQPVTGTLFADDGGGLPPPDGSIYLGQDLSQEIFIGRIGEFKVWNVALSSAQAAADFAGTPVLPGNNVVWLPLCGRQNPEPDKSGNNNTGMATGAPAAPDTPLGECSFIAEENGFIPMSSITSKTKSTVFVG